MGEGSKIEWCDHTFNPWWGCTKVSEGCKNCYALSFAKRTGFSDAPRDPKKFPIWGDDVQRRFFGNEHWKGPRKWNADAVFLDRRPRVFCSSMADVFEDRPELVDIRARLFRLIEETTRLDWLLLTKRPQNIERLAAECTWFKTWPENVWIGTTCETQERADERIPFLMKIGASVRFVSYEPALEAVDFSAWISRRERVDFVPFGEEARRAYGEAGKRILNVLGVDWIICGGESGPGARPFDVAWAREVLRLTRGTETAAFVKQLGSKAMAYQLGDVSRLPLVNRAGGDWSEWPEDLRVREFPAPRIGSERAA